MSLIGKSRLKYLEHNEKGRKLKKAMPALDKIFDVLEKDRIWEIKAKPSEFFDYVLLTAIIRIATSKVTVGI